MRARIVTALFLLAMLSGTARTETDENGLKDLVSRMSLREKVDQLAD